MTFRTMAGPRVWRCYQTGEHNGFLRHAMACVGLHLTVVIFPNQAGWSVPWIGLLDANIALTVNVRYYVFERCGLS